MMQNLSLLCYLAFFVLAFVSPFLPLFLLWRTAVLSVVAIAAAKLIEAPVHWSDQDLGYAIGSAIIFLFGCVVAVAIILRLTAYAIRNPITAESFIGPKDKWKSYFDCAALGFAGCAFGLKLSVFLAYSLSGIALGQILDVGIAISAMIFAIAIIILIKSNIKFAASAAFLSLAIIATTGSFQTSRILKQGETLASGRAWCLTTYRHRILELEQVGFFSLKKGYSSPHLVLLVRDKGQIQLIAHWSIRQQAFVKGVDVYPVPSCYPEVKFATGLKNGKIEDQRYAVGPDVYFVPTDFFPIAYTNRLSVRSNMFVGLWEDAPKAEAIERIHVTYNVRLPNFPHDTIPPQQIPNLDEINQQNLANGGKLTIASIDEKTGHKALIDCSQGPLVDAYCRIRIFNRLITYEFYLPGGNIREWPEAANQVSTLIKGMRSQN